MVLAFSLGSLVQEIGCNQKAHYALVRALAEGTAIVDEYQAGGLCDLAYTDGHYYAAKAPGLAFAVLPVYVALDAADAVPASRGRRSGCSGSSARSSTALVAAAIAGRLAGRVAPGTGVFVAATLAVGTLLLPFATLFFAHALAAALAVGAFALLWRDRLAPATAALAGLLTGFAAVVEHPAALVAPVLGAYALVRFGARRAGAYAGGAAVGVLPLLAYNQWAFGSVTHFAVVDVISVAGNTGHDVVGGQDRGVFGALAPSTHVALELLASARGLLTVTPVVAAGWPGSSCSRAAASGPNRSRSLRSPGSTSSGIAVSPRRSAAPSAATAPAPGTSSPCSRSSRPGSRSRCVRRSGRRRSSPPSRSCSSAWRRRRNRCSAAPTPDAGGSSPRRGSSRAAS